MRSNRAVGGQAASVVSAPVPPSGAPLPAMRPSRAVPATLLFLCLSACPTQARADAPAEQLEVTGAAPPVSVPSPDRLQPQTTLGAAFLRDVPTPLASYDEIARLAPSVLSVSPNGPGLGEASVLGIRGFSDGQYNVTFDGIPFADTDDFTHHSDSYFAEQALGGLSVDRGPGTAATIGNATFGGTIALRSIRPADTGGVSVSGSVGSFDTGRAGIRVDSGLLPTGTKLVLEAEAAGSNGALTGSGVERRTLFGRLQQQLGSDLSLTVAGSGGWLRQHIEPGATRAQIAAFGPGFALGDDPASQNDSAYNGDSVRTDLAYAALRWEPSPGGPGLVVDERAYTYGLDRHFSNGLDPNGETPNGTASSPFDVPGQAARNGLRALGDVLRIERGWRALVLRAGVWGEHQRNGREQVEIDLSRGGATNPVLAPVAGVPGSAAIDRLQQDTLDTVQPYAELEWRPWPGAALVPGVRWAYARRGVAAPVMEGTRLPTYESAAWSGVLPSLAARQALPRGWSLYGQAAEGLLAPQLQLLDTTLPADRVRPERTVNLQAGADLVRPGLSLSLDGYVIQFDNLAGTRTVGTATVAFNEGGATYLGLEAEATVGVGGGISLYGNASLNRARDHDTGAPVPNAPDATAAGGLLFRRADWFASLLDKWVGARFGDTNRQAGLDPFNQLDGELGRTLGLDSGRRLRLELQALNLLDRRGIDALAGYTVTDATPLWYTQPGRSLWMTATLLF